MLPTYFKAVLKSQEGEPLGRGLGYMPPQGETVDFKGEFVPLLKLGTPVQIVRVVGGRESHSFCGQVYLSTQKLLRITSVNSSVLLDNQRLTAVEAPLPAVVMEETPARVPFWRKKQAREKQATVYYLSKDTVKFTSSAHFDKGRRLLLDMGDPIPMNGAVLEVYEIIQFGTEVTGHLCHVIALPDDAAENLAQYLEGENRKQQEPPPDTPPSNH